MKTYSAFSLKAKNSLIVLLCLMMYQSSVLAQRQVIGRILDKDTKNPIRGAKVIIKESDSTTVTNAVGYFQIAADTANYILISSPGYDSGLVKVPKADKFQFYLTKYKVAEEPSSFEDFDKFLKTNLKYPEPARRNRITGSVYVSFETDSLGKMQHITLLKDIGGSCGMEVIRVLKACPKGLVPKSANARFILPVTFEVAGNEQKSEEEKIDLPTGKLLSGIVLVAYIPK